LGRRCVCVGKPSKSRLYAKAFLPWLRHCQYSYHGWATTELIKGAIGIEVKKVAGKIEFDAIVKETQIDAKHPLRVSRTNVREILNTSQIPKQ
jgi:hypothetical protein